jgi:hypothetical protein
MLRIKRHHQLVCAILQNRDVKRGACWRGWRGSQREVTVAIVNTCWGIFREVKL